MTETKTTRYFKCMIDGECAGRYTGVKPKQAANKAFTAIIRNNGGSDSNVNKPYKFEIVECTRGCRKKSFNYEGVRIKLETPLIVQIGKGDKAKQITYNFTNKIAKQKVVKQKVVKQKVIKEKVVKQKPAKKEKTQK